MKNNNQYNLIQPEGAVERAGGAHAEEPRPRAGAAAHCALLRAYRIEQPGLITLSARSALHQRRFLSFRHHFAAFFEIYIIT